MTTLYVAGRDGVTLSEALTAAPGDGTALLTGPWEYRVTTTAAARSGDTAEVFEARVFGATAELRWIEESAGRGRAVLLTEDPAEQPPGFTSPDPIEAVGVVSGSYLLWGRVAARDDGWSTLTTERVGAVRIPAEIEPGQHAVIATREYIVRDPHHGNAYVAAERLLGFTAAVPVRRDKE
jgi:CRISPR-associated protein (TIGR03984 family)